MSLVEVRGLSRLWDGAVGLHHIDLTVEQGEFVVVRGRSGSGKSTLLALLAGLCDPDDGEVMVNGAVPRRDTPWSLTALVPQVLALASELSARENVTDSARLATRHEVDELLAMLDLSEVADRTLHEMSMGQQQRVAVARAMAVQPKLLMADEPTSFQDDAHGDVVVAALRQAAVAGSSVLVATHDPLVIAEADRVIEVVGADR